MLSSMQQQTSCFFTTANTWTHTHRHTHTLTVHTHIYTSSPLNWPKCVACDSENETQTWSGECLVAMGMFSGRQSAWWCLYKEGWMITRTKFVCQLHRGGKAIIKNHKGSSVCLLVSYRKSQTWHPLTITCLQPFVTNQELMTGHLLRM